MRSIVFICSFLIPIFAQALESPKIEKNFDETISFLNQAKTIDGAVKNADALYSPADLAYLRKQAKVLKLPVTAKKVDSGFEIQAGSSKTQVIFANEMPLRFRIGTGVWTYDPFSPMEKQVPQIMSLLKTGRQTSFSSFLIPVAQAADPAEINAMGVAIYAGAGYLFHQNCVASGEGPRTEISPSGEIVVIDKACLARNYKWPSFVYGSISKNMASEMRASRISCPKGARAEMDITGVLKPAHEQSFKMRFKRNAKGALEPSEVEVWEKSEYIRGFKVSPDYKPVSFLENEMDTAAFMKDIYDGLCKDKQRYDQYNALLVKNDDGKFEVMDALNSKDRDMNNSAVMKDFRERKGTSGAAGVNEERPKPNTQGAQ